MVRTQSFTGPVSGARPTAFNGHAGVAPPLPVRQTPPAAAQTQQQQQQQAAAAAVVQQQAIAFQAGIGMQMLQVSAAAVSHFNSNLVAAAVAVQKLSFAPNAHLADPLDTADLSGAHLFTC